MRLKPAHIPALTLLAATLLAAPAAAAPRSFFGIAPQTALSPLDVEYMRAGRIGAIRIPVQWSAIQPSPNGPFDWRGMDETVALAARGRLRVLPFLYSTPGWLAPRYTALPIDSPRRRRAWAALLRAAVARYGPRGEFWREHGRGSGDFVPRTPVRDWQIWNEANFFYFTRPASPLRYARLVRLSDRVLKRTEPGARTILAGLFGEPSARRPNAMPAADFLRGFYRVPGIAASFDGIALHPYAETAADLARMTEAMRRIALQNDDRSARLYITEMGWGSEHAPNLVSFERGVRFQLREMRRAYRYLLANRGRLNLHGVYWFSWKDSVGTCNFCDSVGLFRSGERLRPKPAWRAFVGLSGGRARP